MLGELRQTGRAVRKRPRSMRLVAGRAVTGVAGNSPRTRQRGGGPSQVERQDHGRTQRNHSTGRFENAGTDEHRQGGANAHGIHCPDRRRADAEARHLPRAHRSMLSPPNQEAQINQVKRAVSATSGKSRHSGCAPRGASENKQRYRYHQLPAYSISHDVYWPARHAATMGRWNAPCGRLHH